MMNWNLLKKIRIIILSRIKKTKVEKWAKERMKICRDCPYNTKNQEKISTKQKIVRFFSNLLTFITTGRFNEDNSECGICFCTLTYKVTTKQEVCEHPDGDKWKSVYIPNSAQKIKFKR